MNHFNKIIFLLALVIGAVTVITAQEDILNLNNKETFTKKQRPPVKFPHSLHMEGDIDCLKCHHDYRNGKNILKEENLEEGNSKIKCSNCHRKNKINNRINLRNAFHIQCAGCHRKMKKEAKKTGPHLCGGCHPWKNRK